MKLANDPCTPTGNAGAGCWQLMYEVFRASKPYLEEIASHFGLTTQQLHALKQLDTERPLAMSQLASSLACDASNVTAIVDKLESRGFVERRSGGADRRVKELIVTAEGIAIRERIEARMQQPPPAIANLPQADREALCTILRKALDSIS